ncbi:MAG: TlpA family protein disulfide reductase [Solirubrobacteraceae bacterium]
MRRRGRVVTALAAATAVVVALAVFGLASQRGVTGKPAPALPGEVLVAPRTTLAALHGHAAALVFWASWCGPCQTEAGPIERFSRTAAGRGRIVGVDWRDGLSGAREFVAHNRWSFPNVRDEGGTIGNAYELAGLPTTFVIDRIGRIRQALRGPQTAASLTRALAAAESA